jgi:predicted GTPase
MYLLWAAAHLWKAMVLAGALVRADNVTAVTCTQVLSRREMYLLRAAVQSGKAVILAANKADLLTASRRTALATRLAQYLNDRCA